MTRVNRLVTAAAAIAALALGAATAEAKQCFKKHGLGTAGDTAGAKFQVDEVLLQSTDWGAWAAWMAGAGTPGYSFGPRTYKCKPGGVGVECRGSATICKL